MRLWSLHPKYLDAKGIVALWREALLASHVLYGKTKGYIHHPQLHRFRQTGNPRFAINEYLSAIYNEATARGYHFDPAKIEQGFAPAIIPVTAGQLAYEWKHLLRKLKDRDPEMFRKLKEIQSPEVHPMFRVIAGSVEHWEKVS